MADIGVLGAGTWGMALARMLALNGHNVIVWSALSAEIDSYITTRRNPNLPDMEIPMSIGFTKDIAEACKSKDMILFAVPSVYVRSTAKACCEVVPDGQLIVDVAKGIEPDTLLTLTEVIRDELGATHPNAKYVALSGPTHAEEVAKDLPTCIVSACEDLETAKIVQQIFTNPLMRVYTNTDIKGVEICGALKNIIALAAGIALGLGYGDNAKAAIITRGLREMHMLGIKMGCREETFSGLTGLGDLIVTATSIHSRNNHCGRLIGSGMAPADAIKEVGMVVEGINAIPAAIELSQKYGIKMPIVEAVDNVVNHGVTAEAAATTLMTYEIKSELRF